MNRDSNADYTAAQRFTPGDRVELHPGLDLWMRGARYGEVRRLGPKYIAVVKVDSVRRLQRIPYDRLRHA